MVHGLEGLGADPNTLNLTAGQGDTLALNIGLEKTLCILNALQTNTAALFADTSVRDASTLYWALLSNETNFRHDSVNSRSN